MRPPLAGREKIYQMAEVFQRSGFTEAGVLRVLGVAEYPITREIGEHFSNFSSPSIDCTPLETLTQLFILGHSVNFEAFERAIAPMKIEDFESANLIRSIKPKNVQSLVRIFHYGQLVAIADAAESTASDAVMGLAPSSRSMLRMMIKRSGGSMLDVGTGGGLLSIAVADKYKHVTAIDINHRAISFAKFNAALNRIENIEFRQGDLFEPVAGQKFDLAICNPPFVIAPEVVFSHTSSKFLLDGFCETVVRNIGTHLNDGGFAQIACNWVNSSGYDTRERAQGWTSADCDMLVLHSHSEDVAAYAKNRVKELALEPSEKKVLYQSWIEYLERENVESIGFGLVNIRKSSKKTNWFRYEELPQAIGPCSSSIERLFYLEDFLVSANDESKLLKTRLIRPRDVEIEDISGRGTLSKRIFHTEGLNFTVSVNSDVAEVIGRCKDDQTLGEIFLQMTAEKKLPPEAVISGFLKMVRGLIGLGFLVPTNVNDIFV